jgi:hypothetical protein
MVASTFYLAGAVLTCIGARPKFKYGDASSISNTLAWQETMCPEF